MLARFRKNKKLELEGERERRPFLATECDNVREAEKWRHQITREIAKGIAQIQNGGLGEYRIRDLNDDINKKQREKRHWQDRIKDLGGPDYKVVGPRMLDHEGKEVPGERGYKYYGAARDLPGVRELFHSEVQTKEKKKTRGEILKHIDADYYGYRDEEDGVLVPLEEQAEVYARQKAHEDWLAAGGVEEKDEENEFYKTATLDHEDTPAMGNVVDMETDEAEDGQTPAHVNVPTQDVIAELLLQKKKQMLMEKYASEELQKDTATSNDLVGAMVSR